MTPLSTKRRRLPRVKTPVFTLPGTASPSRAKCQLACALSIYVTFEDGTLLDDTTIGQVLGASSGLEAVNRTGLVAHFKETDNLYSQVLNGGDQWAHGLVKSTIDDENRRWRCWARRLTHRFDKDGSDSDDSPSTEKEKKDEVLIQVAGKTCLGKKT